jgi:polyphosphate kinase
LVHCAASSNNVNEIYITAYRLGKNSSLIRNIITATNNNIKCKLYLELSARGEVEQDLIYLDKLIHEANTRFLDIKVRYNGIKVHGKMIYIGLKDGNSIGVFSTGNYNEDTASIYKDYHYISCESSVTDMIKRNFSVLWNSEQPVLSSISNILTNEIYEEIAKGKDGKIWMQTNHLDNKLIVSLLKEAIRRGCDVKLIVRTTRGFHSRELKNCKTVVGKYLEHARVYIFGNGLTKRVYLSSSDILFRNLYNRFESYIKITDNEIQNQLINDFKSLYKNGQEYKKEE